MSDPARVIDRLEEPLYLALVDFQVARLRETYRDFREDERFVLVAEFFFEDVYSQDDKSERDEQFRRLYDLFRRRLGAEITSGVGELVALNDLSNELDFRMVDVLDEMGLRGAVHDEVYEEAYRICDNYPARVEQIEILCRTIRHFRALASHLSIGLALKAVKAAAAVFGGQVVIGFLDRGYRAYRSVTKAEIDAFVEALHTREMARLNRIYRKEAL